MKATVKNITLKYATLGVTLRLWQANNAGRGDNNVTVVVVPDGEDSETCSRERSHLTSGWRGQVNLSRALCRALDIPFVRANGDVIR